MFSRALDASPDWVTVTSFNEWGEGTQVEPALPSEEVSLPGHAYLDYAPHGPNFYLERTAAWADRLVRGSRGRDEL